MVGESVDAPDRIVDRHARRRGRLPSPGSRAWRRRRAYRAARDRLIGRTIRTLRRGMLRFVSLPSALRLADAIGSLIYVGAIGPRRLALRQIAEAMPEVPPASRRAAVRDMARGLARSFVEILYLDQIASPSSAWVDIEGRELMDEALAEGRGVIAITGHIGNWELLASWFSLHGYPVSVVATPVKGEQVNGEIIGLRSQLGIETIMRDGPGASRRILSALRRGRILAILMDQDTRGQAVFVPFLGRPARTPVGPAALAFRTGAVLIAAFIHRLPDGRHRIRLSRPELAAIGTGNDHAERDAWTLRTTAELTRIIECEVRSRPDEWVWWHRRWRRQPAPSTPCVDGPNS